MGGKRVKTNVSILSYNLYCLPWLATTFSPASCPLPHERSSAFLEHIHDYDIVSLQEVWDPHYTNIEKYAKSHNMHVVGSSAPSSFRYISLRIFGGGLMIVSKYPIVDRQEIIFDRGWDADRFVTKGVLYAKVQVGASFVHVFNTHLQASYGYEFDFVNNPYMHPRQKQIKRMTAFIERITEKDNYPIMIMGDFNVNGRAAPDDGADSTEYVDMVESLRSQQYEVVDVLKEHNGGKHPITYGGKGVLPGQKPKTGGQRLDFIFELKKNPSPHHMQYKLSGGAVVPFQTSGSEPFTYISDHYAQKVTMEITARRRFSESRLSEASISFSVA